MCLLSGFTTDPFFFPATLIDFIGFSLKKIKKLVQLTLIQNANLPESNDHFALCFQYPFRTPRPIILSGQSQCQKTKSVYAIICVYVI